MHSPQLIGAIGALKTEEQQIRQQIKDLEDRLEDVSAAYSAICRLVALDDQPEAKPAPPTTEFVQNRGGEQPTILEGMFKPDAYKGMDLEDAILVFMKSQGRPVKASQIAEALLDGGFETKSGDFANVVGAKLRTLKNIKFQQVARGDWAPIDAH